MNDSQAPVRHLSASGFALNVLWEMYHYAPGAAGQTPTHVHETYQVCISVNFPGESRYRGNSLAIPVQSVSVFHPGEPHSSRDRQDRNISSEFRLLYFPSELWADGAHGASAPFFRDAVLTEPAVYHRLLRLHRALREPAGALQMETRLCETLRLLRQFAELPPHDPLPRREPGKVRQMRGYIEENAHLPLRLHELANQAGLSSWHFLRVFRQEVGMPPHAYQTHIRIDRARRLLLSGTPIGEAAFALGFADQSHFTRTFRQVVGCTPQQYVLSR